MSQTTTESQRKKFPAIFTIDSLLSKLPNVDHVDEDVTASASSQKFAQRQRSPFTAEAPTAAVAAFESNFSLRCLLDTGKWFPTTVSPDFKTSVHFPPDGGALATEPPNTDALRRNFISQLMTSANPSRLHGSLPAASALLPGQDISQLAAELQYRASFSRLNHLIFPALSPATNFDRNGFTEKAAVAAKRLFESEEKQLLPKDSPGVATFPWPSTCLSISPSRSAACTNWCCHLACRSTFNSGLNHKRKRFRTAFTTAQMARLESSFRRNRYAIGSERRTLARDLGLTETQIKVWFQNRRTKYRKIRDMCNTRQPMTSSCFSDVMSTSSSSAYLSNSFYDIHVSRQRDATCDVTSTPPVVDSSIDDCDDSARGFSTARI